MADKPTTKPAANPTDDATGSISGGLTPAEASFLLALIEADPKAALKCAGDYFEDAGYPDADSFMEDLVDDLSEMGAEDDGDPDEESDDEEGESTDG